MLSRIINWLTRPVFKQRVTLYKSIPTTRDHFRPGTGYRVVVKTITLIPPFIEHRVFGLQVFNSTLRPWVSAVPTMISGPKRLLQKGWQETSFLDLLTTTGIGKRLILEEIAMWCDCTVSDFR